MVQLEPEEDEDPQEFVQAEGVRHQDLVQLVQHEDDQAVHHLLLVVHLVEDEVEHHPGHYAWVPAVPQHEGHKELVQVEGDPPQDPIGQHMGHEDLVQAEDTYHPRLVVQLVQQEEAEVVLHPQLAVHLSSLKLNIITGSRYLYVSVRSG